MREAAMPHRRTVVAAALVLLAWIAAPHAGELLPVRTPTPPAGPHTIASKTDLAVITSDRPVVSVHPKRGEGQRLPSAMTAAAAGLASRLALTWKLRQPRPLILDEPLALRLAPRGPPLSITP